jgi:hypothetical protein
MDHFPSAREAKEFLVSRIVEEAQRERAPLSDLERKMLYFSETGWTLPDMMSVNDEFDRQYDQDEYEKKMASLIGRAYKHDRGENSDWAELWSGSIDMLGKEDHYILVMVSQAGIPVKIGLPPRPQGDVLKLWGTGFAIVGLFLIGVFFSLKYSIDWGRLIWPIVAGVAFAYAMSLIFVGRQRLNGFYQRVLGWLFGSGKSS